MGKFETLEANGRTFIDKEAYDIALKTLWDYADERNFEREHRVYEYEWRAIRALKSLGEFPSPAGKTDQ